MFEDDEDTRQSGKNNEDSTRKQKFAVDCSKNVQDLHQERRRIGCWGWQVGRESSKQDFSVLSIDVDRFEYRASFVDELVLQTTCIALGQ